MPILVHAQTSDQVDVKKQQRAQKLKALKQQIEKVKRRLTANRSRYDSASLKLKKIEIEVSKTNNGIRKIKKNLKKTQKKLKHLTQQQSQLLKKKSQQQKILAKQIRSAYGNGKEEYLKLLLNQIDPEELGRMLSYFSYLNQARTHEITELSKTMQRLLELKDQIGIEYQQLMKLKSEKKQQMGKLLGQQKQRKTIVKLWRSKVNLTDKQLSSLLMDEKELQSVIEVLRKAIEVFFPKETLKGLARLKGRLRWPVIGRILNKYGSPRYQGAMSWHGVMLKAKEGRPVHSISTGRVVFSDWLRGYGLLTMIDHGDGYLSLYGHNQSLLKQVGDWVEPGEIIAYVGNTGGRASSSLYFEIRHHKRTVNPALWCR